MNILDTIIEAKRIEVAQRKADRPIDPQTLELSRKDFKKALAGKKKTSLIAEIKQASPSEGLIKELDPLEYAKIYEAAGASAISVLTDEKFFRGSLEALKIISENTSLPTLRKDFIIDEYQIHEARAHGADAILLIVAILTDDELANFIQEAKKFKVDALVEVHNEEEMRRALASNAEIIGINNRDLTDFSINLATTRHLAIRIRSLTENGSQPVIVSESGLHNRTHVAQIRPYADTMLIGTSIVKSPDPSEKIKELLDPVPLIKICGMQSLETAQICQEHGVDLIGFNFVPTSKRHIDKDQAQRIITVLNRDQKTPQIVGVFMDQPLEMVNEYAEELDLDYVQLHGDEPAKYIEQVTRPVIRAHSTNNHRIEASNDNIAFYLFDSDTPGSGQRPSEDIAINYALVTTSFLAGGLTPDNVADLIEQYHPTGVDIASGVETDGKKDPKKIIQFINNATGRPKADPSRENT